MSLPVIAVMNVSTSVDDAQIEAVIPALQRQVSEDFKAYWERECSLQFLDRERELTAGWWQVVVMDDPDQAGALGYHELSSQGTPLGKVFARLDREAGASWTVTLSHELLEMLADPWINWCAQSCDGKIYALEVCDPVEADRFGYEIDGVLVSDFVTPAWFAGATGQVDFKGRLSHPVELAEGGYITVLDPGKGWKQVTAGEAGDIPDGSRRQRRVMGRRQWRRSERG